MNVKLLEYIVKISEEKSITKAASELFITQSALDQQLIKLEKELGTRLFSRSKNGFTLTEAGKVYVSHAKQMLNLKRDAYLIIGDMAKEQANTLSIGLTLERGIEMFTAVYPDFYKSYPNTAVYPREVNAKAQIEMIMDDILDIGFVACSEAPKCSVEFISITNDELLLAIPSSHPYAQNASPPGEPYAFIDLSYFKEDTFVLMFKESTQRDVIDPLFEKAGYKPKLIMETSSNKTLYSMVKNGFCCSILPQYYACPDDKIVCFRIDIPWHVYAIYKKGRYIGKAAKQFIKLAADFWNMQKCMQL